MERELERKEEIETEENATRNDRKQEGGEEAEKKDRKSDNISRYQAEHDRNQRYGTTLEL